MIRREKGLCVIIQMMKKGTCQEKATREKRKKAIILMMMKKSCSKNIRKMETALYDNLDDKKKEH